MLVAKFSTSFLALKMLLSVVSSNLSLLEVCFLTSTIPLVFISSTLASSTICNDSAGSIFSIGFSGSVMTAFWAWMSIFDLYSNCTTFSFKDSTFFRIARLSLVLVCTNTVSTFSMFFKVSSSFKEATSDLVSTILKETATTCNSFPSSCTFAIFESLIETEKISISFLVVLMQFLISGSRLSLNESSIIS